MSVCSLNQTTNDLLAMFYILLITFKSHVGKTNPCHFRQQKSKVNLCGINIKKLYPCLYLQCVVYGLSWMNMLSIEKLIEVSIFYFWFLDHGCLN